MASNTNERVTVYVQLLNEGTIAFRPTTGVITSPNTVELLATDDYDPEDENWESNLGH